MSVRDLVDLRLVHLGVDLHLGDVGQAEDLLPLADRRPFLDLRGVAAERTHRVVGVDDDAVAGGEELAVDDLLLELRFLVLLELVGLLLGQLVGEGLLDLALELLDGLVLGVVLEHVQLALGLLEGELGLLEVELLGDLLGLRDVALLVHPRGPVDAVGGPGEVGLGQLDLALDRGLVLQVDALVVLLDRDLGDLAGQLGVLERGLGPLGGDLLVGELVVERGRVELADQVALLDLRPLGEDRDDRRRALDLAEDVLVLRALQAPLLGDRDRQGRRLHLVGDDVHVRAC